MNEAMTEAPMPPAGGPEGMETGMTNQSPNAKPASPAQQEQFDLLLGRARQLLAATGREWLAALKAHPVQAAVSMGTQIVRQLVQDSEKAGQPVDPAVLVNVGVQFVKDIAGIANASGAVPDEQLKPFLKDVMAQSIAAYIDADRSEGLMPGKQPGQPAPGADGGGMLAQMQGGAA